MARTAIPTARSVMECLAYLAGRNHYGPWTDLGCPVVVTLARHIQHCGSDALGQELAPRLLHLAGSQSTPEVEWARVRVLYDFAVRENLPRRLHAVAKRYQAPACALLADTLAALPEVQTQAQFLLTRVLVNGLRETQIGQGQNYPVGMGAFSGMGASLENLFNLKHASPTAYWAAKDLIVGLVEPGDTMPASAVALLDRMLAVGDTQPLPATPDIEARIADLVEITCALEAAR